MRAPPVDLPFTPNTIDPALSGLWRTARGVQIEITADGTLFALQDALPFTLSVDGQTLTFPTTAPLWQFTRLSGSSGLPGLWERFETDDSGTWREEWHFRSDGSYTFHWSLNGQFDSEGIGTYVSNGTTLSTRERRAMITTGPDDAIILSVYFGALLQGTYSVAPDGQSWTLTTAQETFSYTRLSPLYPGTAPA
ncbi:hypothetical protein [Tropicibacter naphthalenivorans]|uniref:Uncharacterized protein n=1 Tax=Tropicibacter naphthalenivorans TaxID=441103 RepID=A0A0P1GFB9_9RHOB|nr:hypothetical protein [Tropicibacter naphthalenivorans]CUH80159.1 hypothetical protein TRN7648_02848 [Tropicibacter naphthalenivorans]SMC84902.1 hypothetical protein SAMN04488093_105117 [Tropicibacter naphthalenivorans]